MGADITSSYECLNLSFMCLKASVKQTRNNNKGVYQLVDIEVYDNKLLQTGLEFFVLCSK